MFPICEENAWMWRWVNILLFVLNQVVSFLSMSGKFGGSEIGEVSDDNPIYQAAAGYAFSIWGVIYLLNICMLFWGIELPCVGDCTQTQETRDTVWGPKVMGYRYSILMIGSIVWTIVFVQNTDLSMWISWVTISIMLWMLVGLHGNINTAIGEATVKAEQDEESKGFDIVTVIFLWLGITIYTGWVTAATLLNFTIVLARYGFNPEWWSIVLAVFIVGFYPFVAWVRRDPVYPLIGAWATFAIHWKSKGDDYDLTSRTFLVTAAWLALFSVALFVYGCVQGGVYGWFFYPRDAEAAASKSDDDQGNYPTTKMGVTNI